VIQSDLFIPESRVLPEPVRPIRAGDTVVLDETRLRPGFPRPLGVGVPGTVERIEGGRALVRHEDPSLDSYVRLSVLRRTGHGQRYLVQLRHPEAGNSSIYFRAEAGQDEAAAREACARIVGRFGHAITLFSHAQP
jgi:hypothetical protein